MKRSRENVYDTLRKLRKERSSSIFKLNDVHTAEIRRIGFERVIQAGLLPEILQYLKNADLVRLALVCTFFRNTVSSIITSKAHKCLQVFIKDLRTFLHLLDAHQGLISGGVILDILMGRTTEEEEYQMTLCVRDEVTARALIRHLREYEAYTICGKDVTVDMSLAIDSDKLPGQRGIFGHPQQATLTSVKKITSVRKRRGADRVVIDIHFFKPHDSLSIQQIRSLRAETPWLIQDAWSTCLVNTMSLRKLVVYYPDYTFLNKTYKFPNQPPERRGGGFGSRLSGSGEYHQESMLKYLYNVSHTADTTWTYYEVHNDHVPASLPVNLLGLLQQPSLPEKEVIVL